MQRALGLQTRRLRKAVNNRHPRLSVGDRFVPIGWDEAIAEIGAKLRALVDEHGGDSVAFYLGNPISFSFLPPILASGLMRGLGSRSFFQTGSQLAGRPSMGSWLSYGLGSLNENLPAFVVLISRDRTEQGLYARLWGNGFLPSVHAGVQFRSGKDAVLYLDDPDGVSR